MKEHLKILRLAEKNELPDRIDENSELSVDIIKELYDQEYIKAIDTSSDDGISYLEPRITMSGREYINKAMANSVGKPNHIQVIDGKITLAWLAHNVPASFWLWTAGLLLGAFIAGVGSSRLSFVKEIFELPNPPTSPSLGKPPTGGFGR